LRRLLLVVLVALLLPASVSGATQVTVFAAASLTEVFPRIDKSERYSFAGSDQLALQLRQGAPADVFASASPKYAELAYRDGIVLKPVVFATNKLIVLVPSSNPAHITSVYDLRRPGVKLVIGDRTVPIGSYTRQILDALGITTEVMSNVVSQETSPRSLSAKPTPASSTARTRGPRRPVRGRSGCRIGRSRRSATRSPW
jgi:molybdate transport system substrate-binding protein